MNDTNFPYKELSFLVLERKMYSVVFGNWTNPERVVFMFSGNLATWLSNADNSLNPPSSPDETHAAKMIKSAPPGDAYIFFNRLGYQYSDPALKLFFIESIPEFNDAIRNIMIEAIEQPPKEIINFGHSCGGFLLLVDMILGSENLIEPINLRTNVNFLVVNDRQNHQWIVLDPFLPNKIFCMNVFGRSMLKIAFASILVTILNFSSSLCIIGKNKNKLGFFIRPFAEYCVQALSSVGGIFAFITNTYKSFFLKTFGHDPNLAELIDSFSFERQKDCLSLLEKNKGKLQLHVAGFSTPVDFAVQSFAAGFATNPACQKQITNLANLSKYSDSYLQISGDHTYMTTNPNGCDAFRQILEFAYNNRQIN